MKKEIQKLYKDLDKKYGGVLSEKEEVPKKRIESSILALDIIIGGGIPEGRAMELFGKKSSGKSTFALLTVANYQKQNKVCAWIDGENAFDKKWAKTLGVDLENIEPLHPETLEQAGEMILDLMRSNVDLIVIDSIVSLIAEQMDERDINEPQRATQARVNSVITQKIYKEWRTRNSNSSFIFINQIRDNMSPYGSPIKTAGGRALEHFYRIRVEIRAGSLIEQGTKKDKEVIGQEINLRTTENKTYPPHKRSTLDFYFDGKIDNLKSLVYACVKEGIIELRGSYFKYGKYKEQGIENFRNVIDEKELYKELKNKLFIKLGFIKENGKKARNSS